MILSELKRYQEALTAYNRANAIKENDPNVLVGKGYALMKLNKDEEAITAFDTALKIDGNNIVAQQNKEFVMHKLEQKKKPLPGANPKLKSSIAAHYSTYGSYEVHSQIWKLW